jgi:hypothetical protein
MGLAIFTLIHILISLVASSRDSLSSAASPKISEKPTRSAPAARESHFRHLRGRFLRPNRTEVQHKGLKCELWRLASCRGADFGSIGA